jgi:hypothetical protein
VIVAQTGEVGLMQWASALGFTVELARGDAGLALARLLIKENAANRDEMYVTMRGDMRCMTYGSLGYAAHLSVSEPDKGGGPRLVKYKPFPGRDE